jgi:TolA-binding protein
MMRELQHLPVAVVLLILSACASNDTGPTIDDLETRKYKFVEPELEPVQRQQVIESYQLYMNAAEAGDQMSVAMRRLADLQLEVGEESNMSTDPKLNKAGRQKLDAAISTYLTYLQTYPKRKDNDLILYQLAKAYAIKGEPDKSLNAMNQVVRDYPNTRYLDEVQFRRGETLFVLRRYAEAEQAYATIVKRPPGSIYYEKALYKYGWTQFKQNKYQQALGSYIFLLDKKLEQGKLEENGIPDELPRAEKELLDDTLRVVSLSFSYQEDAKSLPRYFAKLGRRPYEPLLYRNLGELYLGKDRITDAADVFLAYVASNPESPLAPGFHTAAIDAYTKGNFPSLVLAAKEDFVKRYGVESRFWQLQTEMDRQKIQPLLARHIRELATHYHAVARKSKKPGDYQRAANWYATYLHSFPNDKDAANMNFLLAETLFDGKQYGRAITEYEKTAYNYPAHARSAEAAYAALLSYKNLQPQLSPQDKLLWQQRAINSALQFSQRFPSDKRVPTVLSKTAEELYALKDYPRAAETAQLIIQRTDITDPAIRKTAWTVYGHAEFELGAYDQAEQAYKNVLMLTSRKDKQYRAIEDRLAASIYKQGEEQRNKGAYQLAATHFLRVGQAVPFSTLRITAQYDAATMYIQMQDWSRATGVLEDFRRRYPQEKKLQQGVTEKLALAYTKTGQGAKAAGEMLVLAAASGDVAYQRGMMWQAAEMYDEAGKQSKAVEVYKSYVKKYPNPLEPAIEARHYLAEYYRKTNQAKGWGYWLNDIVQADRRGGKQRTARTNYLAATATLELAKPHQLAYQKTKLKIPLKKSLKKKKGLMQNAIKAYENAINYKVAEVTTAATYQIGEIYHDFARGLMKSQRPKGLSADELEQYNLLLEEQAYPFEEKAIDIHVANVKRTQDGVYDEWVKKSLQVLGKLQPVRYAKNEKIESYVEVIY